MFLAILLYKKKHEKVLEEQLGFWQATISDRLKAIEKIQKKENRALVFFLHRIVTRDENGYISRILKARNHHHQLYG